MSLQPIGSCQLTCTVSDSTNSRTLGFYITPEDTQPILDIGIDGCVDLGLINRICPNQRSSLTKQVRINGEHVTWPAGHITSHDNYQPIINPPPPPSLLPQPNSSCQVTASIGMKFMYRSSKEGRSANRLG